MGKEASTYQGNHAYVSSPPTNANEDINALLEETRVIIQDSDKRYQFTVADNFILSGDHQKVQDLLKEADALFHSQPDTAAILMKEAKSVLDAYHD